MPGCRIRRRPHLRGDPGIGGIRKLRRASRCAPARPRTRSARSVAERAVGAAERRGRPHRNVGHSTPLAAMQPSTLRCGPQFMLSACSSAVVDARMVVQVAACQAASIASVGATADAASASGLQSRGSRTVMRLRLGRVACICANDRSSAYEMAESNPGSSFGSPPVTAIVSGRRLDRLERRVRDGRAHGDPVARAIAQGFANTSSRCATSRLWSTVDQTARRVAAIENFLSFAWTDGLATAWPPTWQRRRPGPARRAWTHNGRPLGGRWAHSGPRARPRAMGAGCSRGERELSPRDSDALLWTIARALSEGKIAPLLAAPGSRRPLSLRARARNAPSELACARRHRASSRSCAA